MEHKITRIMALISLLIMMTATIPLGYAPDMPDTPDMRLTWNSESDWMPSIAQASDGKIWVVWHSYRTGNADIFYKVYDPSQVHPWSSETRLTTDPNTDMSPSITQAKDGKLWVVWSTNRNGNSDIFYKTSTDNGTTWSPDDNLTADPNEDELPSIMQTANGTIWLSWSTNRTGNLNDIFYKTSTDNGTTWSPDTPLPVANPAADDYDPSITQTANGNIWVVWVRNNDIYYKTYNGTDWSSSDDAITGDSDVFLDLDPSITQTSDGDIWVVWDSDRVGEQEDIYYKIYDGWSWSFQPIRLTTDQASDFMPSIMQATDGTIWIVWTSWRSSNVDTYYRTTEIPQPHDMAIFSVIPSEATVNQDQNVSIEVVAQNHGKDPENFVVRCYADSILINESERIGLAPGQLYPITFLWDTSSTVSGTYTVWAQASVVEGETNTDDNTFPAKILGDLNDDGKVDASDLFDLSKAYGSEPSKPNWNPNCDFNGDKKVNASDLFILTEDYGRS